jgi:hypothetical protein
MLNLADFEPFQQFIRHILADMGKLFACDIVEAILQKAAQITAPVHNDEIMDYLCSPDTSNHTLAFLQLLHGDNAKRFFEALIPKIQCYLDICNLSLRPLF